MIVENPSGSGPQIGNTFGNSCTIIAKNVCPRCTGAYTICCNTVDRLAMRHYNFLQIVTVHNTKTCPCNIQIFFLLLKLKNSSAKILIFLIILLKT